MVLLNFLYKDGMMYQSSIYPWMYTAWSVGVNCDADLLLGSFRQFYWLAFLQKWAFSSIFHCFFFFKKKLILCLVLLPLYNGNWQKDRVKKKY